MKLERWETVDYPATVWQIELTHYELVSMPRWKLLALRLMVIVLRLLCRKVEKGMSGRVVEGN